MTSGPANQWSAAKVGSLLSAFAAVIALSAPGGLPVRSRAPFEVVTERGESNVHSLEVAPTLPLLFDDGKRATLLFSRGAPADSPGWRAADPLSRLTFETASVREFSLAAVRAASPLIRVTDANGAKMTGLGTVDVPAAALLGQLVNAGWVAVAGDGAVVFASALRGEIERYDPDGRLVWRSIRPLAVPVAPPRLAVEQGTLVPRFAEVQHGIAVGPDGRAYVLTGLGRPDSLRLDVIDPVGRFVGASAVPLDADVLADRRGRVHVRVPPAPRADRTGDRASFEVFDLPALDGDGSVRLADYLGRVVVVNFWASWCGPCRREMPLLDRLAGEFFEDGVTVLGLNEDTDPGAGLAFVEEIGGVRYRLAEGRGALRNRYRYFGLPYTVVLDRELHVAATFYGFGDSIEAIRAAVRAEVERGRSAAVGSADGPDTAVPGLL